MSVQTHIQKMDSSHAQSGGKEELYNEQSLCKMLQQVYGLVSYNLDLWPKKYN